MSFGLFLNRKGNNEQGFYDFRNSLPRQKKIQDEQYLSLFGKINKFIDHRFATKRLF